MTLVIAVLYHLITAFIDVAVKGHIKKKYGWMTWYDNAPSFWKSAKLSVHSLLKWEPILFIGTYLIIGGIIFLIFGKNFLIITTIKMIVLGTVGFESILYWWIGSLTGWERVFWRCDSPNSHYYYPDKLRLFEYPPTAPWLQKFPMVYGIKIGNKHLIKPSALNIYIINLFLIIGLIIMEIL